MATQSPSHVHVVLFPFMAKGHTIPIIHLSHLLLRRGAAVTLFTTPANLSFISTSLSSTTTSVIPLPFPDIPGIPSGVESTDKLPSMSLFLSFVSSTKLLQPHFDRALAALHPPATFMVTDGFFGWTLDSANKLGIPRLVYYGMSNYAITVSRSVSTNPSLFASKSDDELVAIPELPWVKITRNVVDPTFSGRDLDSPHAKWMTEQITAVSKSYGLVTNSFVELEPAFADHWNSKPGPKSWSVGPFCLGFSSSTVGDGVRPPWMVWLDRILDQGESVLYVAFGSQSEISTEQFEEIRIGLERSEVNYLWVVRGGKKGFEKGSGGRGMVVEEWVDQRAILAHESVKGFLSHCGWNSVLESICAKVPILAWPLSAEQPLNARFVAEEIKVGVRVESAGVGGFVKREAVEKAVRELMGGEKGEEVRRKVAEFGCAAVKAVEEGGSSWRSLNDLIGELQCKSKSVGSGQESRVTPSNLTEVYH